MVVWTVVMIMIFMCSPIQRHNGIGVGNQSDGDRRKFDGA